MLAIINTAKAQDPDVPAALAQIAADFAARGVKMGSHDDGDADTRAFFRGLGAQICEFPTSFEAARAAKAAGEPVLMGAPNVVRGGSQSGNIAAQDLVEAGLCDALVSDYYYPALSQTAWALVDRGVCDLVAAWALISTNPAQIAVLSDRGHLHHGARADVVAVNPETQRVELTFSAGRCGASVRRTGAPGAAVSTLDTKRLILRRPLGTDLPAYRAYCMSNRTRFTGGPYTSAQSTEKLAAMIGHWDIRGYGRMFFCDRTSGRAMGHVGALHLVEEDVPEMTWTIWSDADEGKGLAQEAAHAYLDHIRTLGPFPLLLAHIEQDNHRSRQLAQRLGAVLDPSATGPDWMPNGLTFRFDL